MIPSNVHGETERVHKLVWAKQRILWMLWIGLLAYGVILGTLCLIWVPNFVSGRMSGPYWLMIAFNATTLLVIGVALFCMGFAFAAFGQRTPEKYRDLFQRTRLALIAVLSLAGLLTCFASLAMYLIGNFRHSEVATIEGRVYQVAIYHDPIFGDEKPYVYQCDQLGLWCKFIFKPAISDTPRIASSRLLPGESPGTESLEICWEWGNGLYPDGCETRQIPPTKGDTP